MAVAGDVVEVARLQAVSGIEAYAAALRGAEGARLGEGLIHTRQMKDRLEAVFVEALGRFDKSGEYVRDGVDLVGWVREKCRYSGGAAAERVGMARQLDNLPETKKAFARGELAFQHVAVMARTAEHVGAAMARKAESSLLRLAETMDPGQFINVARNFEHQVDAEKSLADANRAHQRRYLNISEPLNGMVRLDGLLDAEAGAIVHNAINATPPPAKDDDRTPAQRRADRLVELCLKPSNRSADGSGSRPHLIIRASVETLAGVSGAAGGELDDGTVIPAETVRRMACDAAISRIIAKGEREAETTRASRTIPPSTRRALAARDHGCVVVGCNRPARWTDAHHVEHWTRGGPTVMSNLILLCKHHHRLVHEGGATLQQIETARWRLIPPMPRSRSA
ncbi:MAG TPA: DUF222 domain-containing protein [Candidatus Dormibacteraeota bacterium]|nr:DUF222 domain-containing protein [Candidatus Dormibacteraeota bacterium]